MFGAAKDRLLPDVLSGLHTQYRTPVPAIIYLVSLKCQLVYSKCRLMHWSMRCIQHDMGDNLIKLPLKGCKWWTRNCRLLGNFIFEPEILLPIVA